MNVGCELHPGLSFTKVDFFLIERVLQERSKWLNLGNCDTWHVHLTSTRKAGSGAPVLNGGATPLPSLRH